MSQAIFFAHANGFPSATYSPLFTALAPEYQVNYLAQHGHDPRFPVNANWHSLVEELIHHLQDRVQQSGEPVWGVGHSLGGLLHYHAALLQPQLYRGVVMLDSPVLTTLDQVVLRAAKRFGFIDHLTPAGRTLGRREEFSDSQEAHRYFAGKSLFRGFHPDCLNAYIEHGLHEVDGRLRLRFDPATEISIYRNVPHTSPGQPQHLQVPLAIVRGEQSRVVLPHMSRKVRRAAVGETFTLPGGHMFPLEQPDSTALLLKKLLTRWAQTAQHKESA
ncbi:MAG: alpha/beta hydrolase [Pseudomonas marincola]|uniref:alpha/beta fold hydrolase n=1 Tax=Pseudomonas marincola TaxID=437900 RepID=UPI003002543D